MKNYAYVKVYESIRDQIVHGAYPLRSCLHSKRVLAKEYHVSKITVEHALDLLVEEGYILPQERVGYRVIYKEESVFPVSSINVDNTPAERNESSYFPYSVYAKTVRQVLSCYQEKVLSASPMQGNLELRTAIKNYLARSRNIFVQEDQIVIGAGSESFYPRIVELFGRSVVYGIESPGYEKVEKGYLKQGVRIDRLQLGNQGILQTELHRTPSKVLHVTPFSSYPTNISASAFKRQEYLDWAARTDGILIEDDYASEFLPSAHVLKTLFSEDTEGRVIYMNSFHKTISPSIRVSYMVLPANKVQKYMEIWKYHSAQVSTLDQLVIADLLNSGNFERNLNRLRKKK